MLHRADISVHFLYFIDVQYFRCSINKGFIAMHYCNRLLNVKYSAFLRVFKVSNYTYYDT